MLMVAQQRCRRLNAPDLLAKVVARVTFVDGLEVSQEVAAQCEFPHLLTVPQTAFRHGQGGLRHRLPEKRAISR